MNDYINVIWFLAAFFSFFVLSWMNDSLFYRQELKACKKFNGNCNLCKCWSCHRKDYMNFEENVK